MKYVRCFTYSIDELCMCVCARGAIRSNVYAREDGYAVSFHYLVIVCSVILLFALFCYCDFTPLNLIYN